MICCPAQRTEEVTFLPTPMTISHSRNAHAPSTDFPVDLTPKQKSLNDDMLESFVVHRPKPAVRCQLEISGIPVRPHGDNGRDARWQARPPMPRPALRLFPRVLLVNIDHNSDIRRDCDMRPTILASRIKRELVGRWSVSSPSAMHKSRQSQ
jgi:hypothetical protein